MNGIQLAETLFHKIIGMKPTRVKLGHGSFITIDFGMDITKVINTRKGPKTIQYGEWHFWIYMCAWRLDCNMSPLVGADHHRDLIGEKIKILENKNLLSGKVVNNAFDVVLSFEDNLILNLFSFQVSDHQQWLLFTPEKRVFVAGPATTWSFENSD